MAMTKCETCGGEYNEFRLDEHCCGCTQLRAEVAELRKDADRWNFVITKEPYASNLWNALPKRIYQQERHLNNAIDAAMKEQS